MRDSAGHVGPTTWRTVLVETEHAAEGRTRHIPSARTGLLMTSSAGASGLGPLSGLDRHRAQYATTVAALADGTHTTVLLAARS